MRSVKVTVVLDESLVSELHRRIPGRYRSAFISDILRREFASRREVELANAYKEAFEDTRAEATEFDGSVGDGID